MASSTSDAKAFEAARAALAAALDIEIPDTVTLLPERAPANQAEWWLWIQELGAMQNGAYVAFTHNRPWGSAAAVQEITEPLVFWAGVVAAKYALILPEGCPRANKTVRAGQEVPAATRAIIREFYGGEVEDVIPYPPAGQMWWWDWYDAWSAFGREVDALAGRLESEWDAGGRQESSAALDERIHKAIIAYAAAQTPVIEAEIAALRASNPKVGGGTPPAPDGAGREGNE